MGSTKFDRAYLGALKAVTKEKQPKEKGSTKSATKPRSVGDLLKRGINPVGLHVMTMAGKLGTVRAVIRDDSEGFSQRLDVRHFNGEPWDFQPLPSLTYVIE